MNKNRQTLLHMRFENQVKRRRLLAYAVGSGSIRFVLLRTLVSGVIKNDAFWTESPAMKFFYGIW